MRRLRPDEERETLERIAAAREEDTIRLALEAARERLGMEAAYVNRIDARSQVVEQVAGDAAALGLGRGTEIPLEETYCSRMLAGELPNVVPDASTEPAVRGLRATEKLGSYVGVAVTLADGTVHGSLCCASSRPRDDLGEAEVAFMRILAGMVAARIDRSRARGRP